MYLTESLTQDGIWPQSYGPFAPLGRGDRGSAPVARASDSTAKGSRSPAVSNSEGLEPSCTERSGTGQQTRMLPPNHLVLILCVVKLAHNLLA